MGQRILIVDDDPVQRRLLENMVARAGYRGRHRRRRRCARSRMLTGADGGRHRRGRARPRDARSRRPRRARQDARGAARHSGHRADRAWRHRQCRLARCAPAPPISWSSRSAPSGCRSRCATRSRRSALAGRTRPHQAQPRRHAHFKDIITRSARMQAVLRTAEKAVGSAIPVLIEGQSGVGKELIARAIHGSGERRAQALRRGQLRRDPRQPRRVAPVRAREGRLHRRHRAACRQIRRGVAAARCSSTRSANCRRPRRSSSCAPSRRARSSRSARASRSRSTCGSSRRPTAT